MKQRKYLLLTSLFTAICLIIGPAYGQSVGNGKDSQPACGHACPGSCGTTIGQAAPNSGMQDDAAMPDLSNIPATPEEFIANHPRLAKAWKFLNDEG